MSDRYSNFHHKVSPQKTQKERSATTVVRKKKCLPQAKSAPQIRKMKCLPQDMADIFLFYFCRHILQMCFLVFGGHILWGTFVFSIIGAHTCILCRPFVSADIFCADISLYLFYAHKLSCDGHFFLPTYLVENIFLRFFCGHILWQKCLYLGDTTGPDSIPLFLKIQSCSEFTCVYHV